MSCNLFITRATTGQQASWLLMSLLLAATVANAAEDDEVVVGPIVNNPQLQDVEFGQVNFDEQLFESEGDSAKAIERLRNRTELQLAEIDRTCQLSAAQRQKLQFAASGDRLRFLGDVEVLRGKFNKMMKEQKQNANDPNAFNEAFQQMWQEMQPLQMRIARGLTADQKSLFSKVLATTLTSEQRAAYQAVIDERRRFRQQAIVASTLRQLEDSVLLTEKQHEELTKLMLALPPPKQTGHYDQYVVLIRLSFLPPEELEPLFEAKQWKSLKLHLDQYRQYKQPWLDAGILDPEDFPEPAK